MGSLPLNLYNYLVGGLSRALQLIQYTHIHGAPCPTSNTSFLFSQAKQQANNICGLLAPQPLQLPGGQPLAGPSTNPVYPHSWGSNTSNLATTSISFLILFYMHLVGSHSRVLQILQCIHLAPPACWGATCGPFQYSSNLLGVPCLICHKEELIKIPNQANF